MKARIKRLWIRALRSGKYKQGKGKLRGLNDTFCCLGVLCNLHAMEHPEIAKRQQWKLSYMGHTETLPVAVQLWAGLHHANPRVQANTKKGYYPTLAEANDKGESFRSIAKIIERKL